MLKAFSVGTTGEQLQSLRRKIELDTEVAEKQSNKVKNRDIIIQPQH